MVESFVIHCVNGFTLTPGEQPVGVSLMDLMKPEYRRSHYSWESNGAVYTRTRDSIETCAVVVAPNKKYLVVTQSTSKYGANNLLVLNEDGSEKLRLINPYLSSSEYQEGDQCEFVDAQCMGDKLLVKIAVTRFVPSRNRNAEPVYGTFYDCDTWQGSPLVFIDSRNL